MSRRCGGKPDDRGLSFLPSLDKMSIRVTGEEISARKRKARKTPADFANESDENADELSREEVQIIAEQAAPLIGSLIDQLDGQNVQKIEAQTRLLLTAQPSLFQVGLDKIRIRTTQLENAMNMARPNNRLACPPGSSATRLLQSFKAPFFAMAHHPFSEPWPTEGPFKESDGELAEARKKVRQAASLFGRPTSGPSSAAGTSSDDDTVDDGNLKLLENKYARILLFGDVQVVPFPKRMPFLKMCNDEVKRETVSRAMMDAIQMHMKLMFYVVSAGMEANKSFVPGEFAAALVAPALEVKKGLPNMMIRHILDDLGSSVIDEHNSMLVKEYWKYLYMMFDTTVDLAQGQYKVDAEAERLRSTEPEHSDLDAFAAVSDAYRDKSPERLTPKDEFGVKAAYIKLFMRIAMFGKWSWFANASVNIFAFKAILFRVGSSQPDSGHTVEMRQRRFVEEQLENIREANNGQLPRAIQRALDGQGPEEEPRSADDKAKTALAEKSMEGVEDEPTAGESQMDKSGTGSQEPRTGSSMIADMVLSAVVEHTTSPDDGRVSRSQTTPVDDGAPQTASAALPRASDAVNQGQIQYMALSKAHREIEKRLQDTQKELEEALSKLESATTTPQEPETRQEELQSDVSQRVATLERQLDAMNTQLKDAKSAAMTRSSSSSCESRNPSRASVVSLQQQADLIEASIRKMKMRASGASALNPQGLDIKAAIRELKQIQEYNSIMEAIAADLKEEARMKQLEDMTSVQRFCKRFYKEGSTDVFGRLYGLYKNGKTVMAVLSFVVRLSLFNKDALLDIGLMGLFGYGSYVMVEVADQLLRGNKSSKHRGKLDQFLLENADMRSFIMLYQQVVFYFFHDGMVLPPNLTGLFQNPFTLPTLFDDSTWGGYFAGRIMEMLPFKIGEALETLKMYVIYGLITAGVFYNGPMLFKWSKFVHTSLPKSPFVGYSLTSMGVLIAEGIQLFNMLFEGRVLNRILWNNDMTSPDSKLRWLVTRLRIPLEYAKDLLQWILSDPRNTVATVATAYAIMFAIKYAQKHGHTTNARNKLARMSKYVQDWRGEPEAGTKTLENLNFDDASVLSNNVLIRRRRTGGDAAEGTGPTGPTGLLEITDTSGQGSSSGAPPTGTSDAMSGDDLLDVDALAKIAGTRIINNMCGTFVLLAEPHKKGGVSIAACAALVLSTDLDNC